MSRTSNRITASSVPLAAKVGVLVALAFAAMGTACDQDAQAVFRQAATGNIGEGVKDILAGDAEGGIGTIVTAAIDGVVASIQQAGDGPAVAK